MPPVRPFDKYAAYAQAVQSPRDDARALQRIYRKLSKREPKIMREDFCGAYALCCEWAKLGPEKKAIGLDIDPEALAYGTSHYLPKLDSATQRRVTAVKRNVLSPSAPAADMICALNFSYFTFHDRKTLLTYFERCRRSLLPRGLFMVDVFGGPLCQGPCVDVQKLPGLTYYWEQVEFDPINNHSIYHIHFKPKGGKTYKRAFTYDWRMWSIPEIRDLMIEAGFKDTVVFWEGTARDGTGSGRYNLRTKGESCDVWLAYVVGRI